MRLLKKMLLLMELTDDRFRILKHYRRYNMQSTFLGFVVMNIKSFKVEVLEELADKLDQIKKEELESQESLNCYTRVLDMAGENGRSLLQSESKEIS